MLYCHAPDHACHTRHSGHAWYACELLSDRHATYPGSARSSGAGTSCLVRSKDCTAFAGSQGHHACHLPVGHLRRGAQSPGVKHGRSPGPYDALNGVGTGVDLETLHTRQALNALDPGVPHRRLLPESRSCFSRCAPLRRP